MFNVYGNFTIRNLGIWNIFDFEVPFILIIALLPPATKLRQGNIFTPVCHSIHSGACHAHLPAMHAPLATHAPLPRMPLPCTPLCHAYPHHHAHPPTILRHASGGQRGGGTPACAPQWTKMFLFHAVFFGKM